MAATKLIDYWFGEDSAEHPAHVIAKDRKALWWGKDDDQDREIDDEFGAQVRNLLGKKIALRHAAPPDVLLTQILLLDQCTRNIFRGTAEMYDGDAMARNVLTSALACGADARLPPIQRVFMYMPLEHSESIEHQDRCVAFLQPLVDEASDADRDTFAGFVDFAEKHRQVIREFGRFPHRNAILDRESTPEEQAYLDKPGSGF